MADPRFPPVQGGPARPGPASRKTGKLPLLPIVLLVIYGLYIGVLIIAPALSKDLEETMEGFFPPNFRFIVGGILLGAFALIMVINLLDTGKPGAGPQLQSRPGPGGEVKKFKPVQPAQARTAPQSVKQPSPPPKPPEKQVPARKSEPPVPPEPRKIEITYPQEVEGGIYGETFIELGQQKVLKLRSLVVEARYLD
jgi:hypothetical protein